ncbi:SprT-like domain-containing protein [Pedobacter sp. SYSU D00535]|uniref:SprT-like domain-containing protein n=1 Tax=Pedobacter sp. SYSU D00535 TaxID=2810308 RepID=UPI001A978F9D|nr:SprT-like domain-containing protein [Pedobacter sp. SYSU D00535]
MEKAAVLANYLPAGAAPLIARWIDYFQCEFKISRNRNTKFGDYRAPFRGAGHRISVNFDLNPFAFLVTTVHEFAHLLTWNEYKGKVRPHGAEWKANFKRMMKPFFDQDIFPPDLKTAISLYLENPAASSCSDSNLFRALKKYDSKPEGVFLVENLPVATVFKISDGRIFRKGERVRKRFKCEELSSGKIYLFNPLAEVSPIGD